MLLKELSYAVRRLQKAPVFSMTSVLTLAFGIGASTAVFTVVDSVILKPLSYRDSGRLVAAWEQLRGFLHERVGPNPRHFELWRERSTTFSDLTLFRYGTAGLAVGTDHPRLVGTVASLPNLFETLRVRPFLGRTFRPEDGTRGRDTVAVLTYPLWQTLFFGDMNIIGKTLRLGDTPREIIGVLPASFRFPNANALQAFSSVQGASGVPEPAVFVPAVIDLNQFEWNGEYGNWIALGRLKAGVAITQAEAQLNGIAQIIQAVPAYAGDKRPGALTASVQSMQEAVVGNTRTPLWLLLAAVIGLLLIACVNLANAQLGRAILRDGEAAVRSALGASKLQLVWSSLAEPLLLATAGGASGVLLSIAALDAFQRYSPVDLPRLKEVQVNLTALSFAVVLTVGSTALFGVLPSLRWFRVRPPRVLQQNAGLKVGSRQQARVRIWLIGVQVLACTVLLLVTGLFSKSLLHLLREEKGFETNNIVVAETRLPSKLYASDQSRTAFIDSVLANLRTIPRVESVGLLSAMPLEGESWIEDLSRADKPGLQTVLNLRWVSPGYFETMREKLLAGRFFEAGDRTATSAVISQGVAKALWQNQSPVGAQIEVEGRRFTVIGVVADSRSTSLKSAPANMAYLHYIDRPPRSPLFVVRGPQPANQLISGVREAIWQYAPDIAIARIKTLDSQVKDSLATERFQTSLLLAFGLSALFLSMLGIYGVLSYSVRQRTQELAVRMALGASRKQMYSLTFGEVGLPIFLGLASGLIIGALIARLGQRLLYGVGVLNPAVSAAIAVIFLLSAFIAALIPARQAVSIDPMEALRTQ